MALQRITNDVFYLKTSRGKEIDFHLPQHNLGVQVCVSLTRSEAKARELEPLSELTRTPKSQLKAALIVTLEEEDMIKIAGRPVFVVPAFKLLALTSSNLQRFLNALSKKT